MIPGCPLKILNKKIIEFIDSTGLNHIMFAYNIQFCFKELESPWKQLHADGIWTHAKVHRKRAPCDHDQQDVIKELHLVWFAERTSRSDITWLVWFSSERIVQLHCILLLDCLFSIFNVRPGIMYS